VSFCTDYLKKKTSNLAEITKGGNFEEFKSGQQHEKHTVATWNLGTIAIFA
jgi:hypothetical protein